MLASRNRSKTHGGFRCIGSRKTRANKIGNIRDAEFGKRATCPMDDRSEATTMVKWRHNEVLPGVGPPPFVESPPASPGTAMGHGAATMIAACHGVAASHGIPKRHGRNWLSLAEFGLPSAEIGPNSVVLRPTAEVARSLAKLGPTSVEHGRHLVDPGPN